MKKIFYKLFIFGGLLTSTSILSSSKSEKKEFEPPKVIKKVEPDLPPKNNEQPENEKDTPVLKKNKSAEKNTNYQQFTSSLKKIGPLLKKRLSIQPPEIQLPSKQDVMDFIDAQKKLVKEEEIKSQYDLLRRLMAPTYLLESTLFRTDEHNVVHSRHMECFYFCTANALTIGYGLKIEFDKKGKLAPEGIEALQNLNITLNGKPLTFEEKEALAYQCIKKRKEYDANNSIKLSKMRYDAQVAVLFPNERPIISHENALETAQIEYTEKHSNLLKRNPFLNNSFYSQALGTDLAYQYGNSGVTKCDYYKNAKQNILSERISVGKDDRLKIRRFLCALAYKYHQDQIKRKFAPITLAEQNAFTLFAVQKYFELFKESIMQRSSYHILLMEHMMTLVMMQHQQDIQKIPLRSFQMDECAQKAHQLVYHQLFHSPIISQLPHRLQPITMVHAINGAQKNLKPWIKSRQLSLTPDVFMERILLSEAEKKIKLYNKKYKKNIALKKTSSSNTNVVINHGSER